MTLETDTKGAQKIALALNVGRLSLLLRSAGDTQSGATGELSTTNLDGVPEDEGKGVFSFLNQKPTTKSIRVVAGDDGRDHTVNIEQPVQ